MRATMAAGRYWGRPAPLGASRLATRLALLPPVGRDTSSRALGDPRTPCAIRRRRLSRREGCGAAVSFGNDHFDPAVLLSAG
jgi:hypothetical protein